MAMNKLAELVEQRENWKKLRAILVDDTIDDGAALLAVVRELCVMVCDAALDDKATEIRKARRVPDAN